MGANDMDHMLHIESVALSDCAVLQSKEATYQGSWKRAGGVSAWFMARRNLDRLITMMAPKAFPDHITTPQNVVDTVQALDGIVHHAGNSGHRLPGSIEATRQILDLLKDRFFANDLFAKIAQHPNGEDGTVLACLRDARRYFTLVEAEMIAEGVVEPEASTYEQEANIYVEPDTDVYQLIADEKGLSRQEVKDRINRLFYGAPPTAGPIDVLIRIAAGNDGEPAHEYVFQACPTVLLESTPGRLEVSITPGPNKRTANGGYAMEQAARHRAEVIADGGSMHAVPQLTPWQLNKTTFDAMVAEHGDLVADFYTRRANNLYQLTPIVVSRHCPKILRKEYVYITDDRWVIKRSAVPEDISDIFPQLQLEKNSKEYEEMDKDYKFMYQFYEDDQKWKLLGAWAAWGKDVG